MKTAKELSTNENLTPNGIEFLRFARRLEDVPNLDIHWIPIKSRQKTPEVFSNWNLVRLTMESAFARVDDLHSNVGLVCHTTDPESKKNGICVLDLDLVEGKIPIPTERFNELLALNTFVTRTRSGGYQFFFVNGGITEHLLARGFSKNPKYSVEGSKDDCGELRTDVAYVLVAGSYVPTEYQAGKKGSIAGATGQYSVYTDNPIITLTPENLPKWILISNEKALKGSKSDTKLQEEFTGKKSSEIDEYINFSGKYFKALLSGEKLLNEKGVSLDEIMEGDREFTEILTVVGDKGTRSERDWYCVRRMRAAGFTPDQCAQALITYRYYDKNPGTGFNGYVKYITLTIRNAFTHEMPSAACDPQSWYKDVRVSDLRKTSIMELPEKLPDKRFVLIQAPPRTGKTHWSIRKLIEAKTGVYTSNKHEIIRHSLRIFDDLEKVKTAVYLVGKNKACNCNSHRGECSSCDKRPRIHPGFDERGHLNQNVLTVQKLRHTASELLHKYRILTPEVLMKHDEICPYYVLLLAEFESDFVFTIPYFLTSDREIKRVKRTDRSLLIIDEDPVCTAFYPSEYEIAKYSYGLGNKSFTNLLGTHMDIIIDIETKINEQKRKTRADKEILRLCGILHAIDDHINTVVDITTIVSKKEFDDWLKTFDISNDYDGILKLEISKKLSQLEQDIKERIDDVELYPIFAPLISVAKKSFCWIGGSPTRTLYIIPDRIVTYIPPDFYKQILLIGATQSELYVQDVCEDANDCEIITIDKFKYADNFLLIMLKGNTRKEEGRMLYSLMFQYANDNASGDLVSPALVLTSSKQKQRKLEDAFKSKCCISTDQSEYEHKKMWLHANMNIMYQNSSLSRGLDVPQYSVMFVDSIKFAIPYFTAMLEYAHETGNRDMITMYKAIISRITIDEVTNSVLRASPIKNDPNSDFKMEDRVKIIVIRERDVGSILESVRNGMHELVINTSENLELARGVLSDFPDRFRESSVYQNFWENSQDPLIRAYFSHASIVILHNKFFSELPGKINPQTYVLKSDLPSKLKSRVDLFPKNNAVALTDPQIRTTVEQYFILKKDKRISLEALINFVSNKLSRKKKPKEIKIDVKDNKKKFGEIEQDDRKKHVAMERAIKKNIVNMVRGELLKEEVDDGRKFYRLFDKMVFGDPRNSKGELV